MCYYEIVITGGGVGKVVFCDVMECLVLVCCDESEEYMHIHINSCKRIEKYT